MKITYIYCEGFHDVAFLAKLIEVLDLNDGEIKKIRDLPDLLRNLVQGAIKNIHSDSIRIGSPLTIFIPNKIYALKDNHYICLFSTGGKTSLKAALANIEKSKSILSKASFHGIERIRHAFILDADYESMDDGGLETTLRGLSTSIQENVDDFEAFNQKVQWRPTARHGDIGTFIFTNESNTEGTLEDLLSTFIKVDELLEPATNYKNSIIEFDRLKGRNEKDIAKQKKIIFTNITQAFHPGSSLAVGLANGNLLNTDIMKEHALSAEFSNFIRLTS